MAACRCWFAVLASACFQLPAAAEQAAAATPLYHALARAVLLTPALCCSLHQQLAAAPAVATLHEKKLLLPRDRPSAVQEEAVLALSLWPALHSLLAKARAQPSNWCCGSAAAAGLSRALALAGCGWASGGGGGGK